ncbi:MAG: hypothetical protein CENE_02632 [Candidatus Celerinatantimonas neptuna]|nr:MAG: hypothetical protein CENE_02632 [Candidatus Celerinatantimonas neptuna]
MIIQRSTWYLLRTELSILDISDKIRAYTFEQSAPFRFDLVSLRESSISIRYSEQYLHIDSFLNAYGEDVTSETVRYKIVNFSVTVVDDDKYLIHIENSPRSTLELFNNFESVLQANFSLTLVSIKILEFLDSLRNRDDVKQFKIKKAVFSGITISSKSRAKIEITSSQNALLDFEGKYHISSYIIDKINCHFRFDGEEVCIELRKSGTISHSKKLTPVLNNELLMISKIYKY